MIPRPASPYVPLRFQPQPSTMNDVTLSASPNVKNQHYVWRHYLNAWAATGTFCCYRHKDRQFLPTQPKSVASETYFYETQQLTGGDLEFLESIIGQATDKKLQELNRDYVKLSQISFQMRAGLKDATLPEPARAALDRELRWAERNLSERYHAGIENKCQDILDWLRNENDDFYRDELRRNDFFYFLSLQYFRTPRMRQGFSGSGTWIAGHDPRRTSAILGHIYATNIGRAFVCERKAYRIVFLKNETAVPFVTGDQPVINTLDPKTTDDVALYYPLSPALAIILTKDIVRFPDQKRRVTSLEVEAYNHAIYSMSEDQVYANDEAYLRSLVAIGKHLIRP